MNKKITDKDKKDWENFIKSNDKVEDKDNRFYKKKAKYEETIDLHGYSLRDANIAVKKLITNSYNKGIKKLNIITGKGNRSDNSKDPYKSDKLGILKYSVPEFIKEDQGLIEMIKKIDIDRINSMNNGEFSIYLKNKKNDEN